MSGDRSYDGDLLTALRRGDQADRLLAGLLAPLRAPEAAPLPTAALATLLAGDEPPAPVGAAHPVVELGRGGPATRGPATASRPRRSALRRAIGAACAAAVLGLVAVLASMPSGDDVVVTPIDESPASSQAPRVDDGHEGRGHLGDHTTPQRTARTHGAARGTAQTVQPGAAAPSTTSGHSGPVPQSAGQHRPRRRPHRRRPVRPAHRTRRGRRRHDHRDCRRRGQPDPAGGRRQRRRRLGRRRRLVGRGLRRRRHRARVAGRRRRRGVGRLSPTSAG